MPSANRLPETRVCQDLWLHMASLWSNKLTRRGLVTPYDTWFFWRHHDTRWNCTHLSGNTQMSLIFARFHWFWEWSAVKLAPIRRHQNAAHRITINIYMFDTITCSFLTKRWCIRTIYCYSFNFYHTFFNYGWPASPWLWHTIRKADRPRYAQPRRHWDNSVLAVSSVKKVGETISWRFED